MENVCTDCETSCDDDREICPDCGAKLIHKCEVCGKTKCSCDYDNL